MYCLLNAGGGGGGGVDVTASTVVTLSDDTKV